MDIEAGSAALIDDEAARRFRLPLRGQRRLTRSVAGGRPVSRLTACARARARAPEVRASLGPRPRAVKETQAGSAYRARAPCAIVWRAFGARTCVQRVQLNGKQAALNALNLCCPRNGKRPAAPDSFLCAAHAFSMPLSDECGREGKAHEAASPDTGQTRRRRTSRRRPPESARDGCEGAEARRRACVRVFRGNACEPRIRRA